MLAAMFRLIGTLIAWRRARRCRDNRHAWQTVRREGRVLAKVTRCRHCRIDFMRYCAEQIGPMELKSSDLSSSS